MMLPKKSPEEHKAWEELEKLSSEFRSISDSPINSDKGRFEKYSIEFDGILFDYSKNLIDDRVLESLKKLAEQSGLAEAISSLFAGEKINETENRSVLHPALRNPQAFDFEIDGENVSNLIGPSLDKMRDFSNRILLGELKGFNGKPIKDIINIGIGGSDLGPVMVTEALKAYWKPGLKPHFISNVDAAQIDEVLNELDPETCLFIIASKTFSTQETMANAQTAKSWFLKNGGKAENIKDHFVAISTNQEEAIKFGIDPENIFVFWDWVGGRYSLWSSIGLCIACTIGFENFSLLLKGAKEADQHFKSKALFENIPVQMALLGIWNGNFLGAKSEAIIPYAQFLHRFPAYLQQANMESNGKSVSRSGEKIKYQTGPVVWGEPGTNAQHAFFQLLHQGTQLIPCDFILFVKSLGLETDQHRMLLANGLAQSRALWEGKSLAMAKEELLGNGMKPNIAQLIAPHREFSGFRPSNTFLCKELEPKTLGSLIAFYEHKIFVQGVIWNIFSFDQWGVELGKEMATDLLEIVGGDKNLEEIDSSTRGLIKKIRHWT
jgi:glucose-6-phosphate isomerase